MFFLAIYKSYHSVTQNVSNKVDEMHDFFIRIIK